MWLKKWLKRKIEHEAMKCSIIDLEEKVKELDNLTFHMRMIINMLIKIHGNGPRLNEDGDNKDIITLSVNHNIQTEKILNLTLEELAKYVIDGKPIIRE